MRSFNQLLFDTAGLSAAIAAVFYVSGIRGIALLAALIVIVMFLKWPFLRVHSVGVITLLFFSLIWYSEAKYHSLSSVTTTDALATAPGMIGASYILVKLITLILDTSRSTGIPRSGVLSNLHYLLFLPSLYSGPMQTRPTFVRKAIPGWKGQTDNVARFVAGITKVLPLSLILAPYALDFDRVTYFNLTYLNIVSSLFLYTLYLYINFSGITDIAISLARAFGYTLPENFDRPYLAPSLREFWRRWHMSFMHILKQYVYVPLKSSRSLALVESRVPLLKSSRVAVFFTFICSALWHNFSLMFVLWGAWHASGMMFADKYGSRLNSKLPHAVARAATGWLGTISFVSLGWIFFVYPTPWILAKAFYATTVKIALADYGSPDAHFLVQFSCPQHSWGETRFRLQGDTAWNTAAVTRTSPTSYSSEIRSAGESSRGPLFSPWSHYEFEMSCQTKAKTLYTYSRSRVYGSTE